MVNFLLHGRRQILRNAHIFPKLSFVHTHTHTRMHPHTYMHAYTRAYIHTRIHVSSIIDCDEAFLSNVFLNLSFY